MASNATGKSKRSTPGKAAPPRWRLVHDALCAELPAHAYGDDFYTIAGVCEKFGVSSITAIRALNELADRNLIEKIPGRGAVVRRAHQSVSIRLITPERDIDPGLNFTPDARRYMGSMVKAAEQQGAVFDVVSETHLQSLFPRDDASYGFLVYRRVSEATCEFLRAHRLPFVFVNPYTDFQGRPHARVDRWAAGRRATEHLLALGHRRIAWVTGNPAQINFADRIDGYRSALREAGVSFRWELIKRTDGDKDPAVHEAALDELMQLRRPPTAIITANDSRAIHILDACKRRDIDVPGDLSVMGYPNNPEAILTDPPLTVMDARYERVGEAAVQFLVAQMLEGADPARQSALIEPELIQRGSTAPPPRRARRTSVMVGSAG